jgi:DNA helicase HerA-like ATPase
MRDQFLSTVQEGYHNFEGSSVTLGTGIYDGIPLENAEIRIPLRTLNRHGLISGATGTGKTVTLQVLAEQFSKNGIPTVLMDLKGDLSGLASTGSSNKHIVKRFSYLNEEWSPKSFPLELLSLAEGEGTKLKATVTEFGPVLMAKILDLNDTQRGILAVLFKYCDDQEIPLIDLQDLKKLLQYATEDGKEEFES